MLRDRFSLLLQRVLRNDQFQAPTTALTGSHAVRAAAEIKRKQNEKDRVESSNAAVAAPLVLTPLESLMSRTKDLSIFGMLTQLVDGQLFIEDLQTSVAIDLSACEDVTDGL